METQPTDWETIFAKHTYYEGFVPERGKEHLIFNNMKSNNSINNEQKNCTHPVQKRMGGRTRMAA